ncbi:unnamed protein product [Prunus brigantina]
MVAVSVKPKAATLEKIDEDIIDVYHGRDPPFSANGLSFLMEFHKDHSATDQYGMTPENREIVELALKNARAKGLLITSGSDSAIKAVYQANRETKARGMPGEPSRRSRPRTPPKIKASTDGTPGTARPVVEGPDDPFFGHEAEDDPTLGISDEEYEGILGMVEEKTLARGGREVEEEAGGGNQ